MFDNNENTMVLIDDDGNEVTFEILFTFESDDYNKKYVLFFDPLDEDENPEVFYSSYDDESLEEVIDEKELEMIEEVFDTFVAENLLEN